MSTTTTTTETSPTRARAPLAPGRPPPFQEVKALLFDVFGTAVDWRTTVESELAARAREKKIQINSTGESEDEFWAAFAQQWHDSYGAFTRSFEPGRTPWKDVDAHLRDSLAALLAARPCLSGAYADDAEEVRELSRVWHRLRPWADAREGLRRLGSPEGGFVTATLSNGNRDLLRDLNDGPPQEGGGEGGLGFQRLLSAEDFGAYKPHPSTYLGAAAALGDLEPRQVAMVAAHLGDLAAARACGLRTIYVERPRREEAWGPEEERYKEAREWVDMWVGEGEGGFIEVARRLGIPE
ncbi:hypothetical protein SLS62_003303 [Diatrype stigma]|uniref:Haloacid dehalogenase n=1 Tax=Diatrype stigma TaxID=117547 RepID=A0AAN9YUF4_9PEZI